MTQFFEITTKGAVINSLKVSQFLTENNFHKYCPSNEGHVFVQVEDKKATIVDKDKIIGFLFKYLDEFTFTSQEQKEIVHDKLSRQSAYIKTNLYSWLNATELSFIKDTPKESYFFFKNCVVKVTADQITTHSYKDFEGNVWKDHIIDKEFTLDLPRCPEELKGQFHEFLYYISPSGGDLISLLSIIGYSLHRYKDPAKAKCIIFYDSNANTENPDGRTGKTLLTKSFEKVRKVIQEDGKMIDPKSKFAFSRVNVDTNLIVFDDVPKNLNFMRFFSVITGDLITEEKFEKRFSIPSSDSPKIILTSNYIVYGEGFSHTDRRIEFFISDFFSPENQPQELFKKRFFEEWDDTDFNEFFNTMLLSVKLYLEKGIVLPRKDRYFYLLYNSSPIGFLELCEETLKPEEKYNKAALFEKFQDKITALKLMGQSSFTSLLKKYADYKQWVVEESHSGPDNFIIFYNPKKA